MSLYNLLGSFPFEPNSAFIWFGFSITPWISLIGVVVITVMMVQAMRKPYSLYIFVFVSATAYLFLVVDISAAHFPIYPKLLSCINFLWNMSPYLWFLCMGSSVAGIVETLVRKLPKRALGMAAGALFCSILYLTFLIAFATISGV